MLSPYLPQKGSTEEGGRRSPIISPYRCPLNFEPWQSWRFNDGEVRLVGRDRCAPGEECEATIILGAPDHVPVAVEPGVRFQLHEGWRVVGDGEVLATPPPT